MAVESWVIYPQLEFPALNYKYIVVDDVILFSVRTINNIILRNISEHFLIFFILLWERYVPLCIIHCVCLCVSVCVCVCVI